MKNDNYGDGNKKVAKLLKIIKKNHLAIFCYHYI